MVPVLFLLVRGVLVLPQEVLALASVTPAYGSLECGVVAAHSV